jgi:ribosomal protein S12 methylthiotransferase
MADSASHLNLPDGLTRRPPVTVGVISLGCPKNLVDSEVMLGLLQEAGFTIVTQPDQADVLLVNTCCFIAPARQESAQALAEAVAMRRAGKAQAVVCAGCWPEMEAGHLRAQFPEIDAFLGPGDIADIVSIIRGAIAGAGAERPAAPPSYLYDDAVPRLRATPPWTAYLKIAEGCDHRCRFCVIPRLRGPYRSRNFESVLREARSLAASGVREINLIAQDTTAYGRDLAGPDLAGLLAGLAAIPDLHWIRLLYTFPSRVADRLIEVMASQPAICKYIDVPFQHADRELLRRMGRPGDGDSHLKLIARLRSAMPDIAIRSTFLVGFPGETEEAFEGLLGFLDAAQLDRAGAFVYSSEAGTPAAAMLDQYHRLMMRQQAISLARNQRWVARELEVLVESRGPSRGRWIGRSFRDAPEIDGSVIVNAGRLRLQPGRFIQARVVQAQPYDLVARASGG